MDRLLAALLLWLAAAAAAAQDWDSLDSFVSSNATGSGGRRLAGAGRRRCELFKGRWVYDNSYSLYDSTCPFIDPQFNCVKYGRPDRSYLKYRWQPLNCRVPSFDGRHFLEQWRGKRIMFVGDSLSSNSWESLACMIHASVPNSRFSFRKTTSLSWVKFEDYGVEILLYPSPYLVDLVPTGAGKVLKIDSMRGGKTWRNADMLVFSSWHWWLHTGRYQPWNIIQKGNKQYKDMNRLVAFYDGMTTWARWVNRYINPDKTKVFFLGISPTHYDGRDWGVPGKTCGGQTSPYSEVNYPGGTPLAWAVMAKVFSRIRKPVYWLDITKLSQYRIDAHPSFYSGLHPAQDCSHWCLPGLPDTWIQLLYAQLYAQPY